MATAVECALPDIVGAIRETKAQNRKVFPCHTNRASLIGGECLRELVYHRTAWDKRMLPSVDLQFIFDGGNLIEPYAVKMLQDAGFQIYEQQRHFEINERGENITGHLDLKVGANGLAHPCEIKGLAGWTWDSLNNVDDFFKSQHHYVRRYPAQLLTYMYGTASEHGCFFLISKQNWQPKVIWLHLADHVEYVQSLLDKALAINEHVKADTLPDFTTNSDLCKRCDFFGAVCNPPMEGSGEIVVDPELEEQLTRWYELRELKSEYDALDKNIKGQIKGREMILGSFRLSGKWVEKGEYVVKASKYWLSKIIKL